MKKLEKNIFFLSLKKSNFYTKLQLRKRIHYLLQDLQTKKKI